MTTSRRSLTEKAGLGEGFREEEDKSRVLVQGGGWMSRYTCANETPGEAPTLWPEVVAYILEKYLEANIIEMLLTSNISSACSS